MKSAKIHRLPLLLLLSLFLIAPTLSIAQKYRSSTPKGHPQLEGKTFFINILSFDDEKNQVGAPAKAEMTFIAGRLFIKVVEGELKLVPQNYAAKSEMKDGKPVIAIVAFSNNDEGVAEIFWKGYVQGDEIAGTMHWFSKQTTRLFSGVMKNPYAEK